MVIRKDQPFARACYHLILRGNNRAFVLEHDADKQYFKRLLWRYKRAGGFELFHYCLMGNHVHLVVRLLAADRLATLMQGLSQSFTNYWKRTRGFEGRLWQSPYRRFLIGDSSYLLECGRYIERNPVRANIVRSPGDYQWSSYGVYSKGASDGLVDLNPEYMSIAATRYARRTRYTVYVGTARPYERMLDAAFMTHTLRKFSPWLSM